ncbi:hypothetical protein LINPERHAP2_LOCUS27880 [Linum perenne]
MSRHSQAWVALIGDTVERDRSISNTIPHARTEVCISWEPAPPEWFTLNSDGSVLLETWQAAVGGLLRDHFGRCLAAFTVKLGNCFITRAELKGVVSGMISPWFMDATTPGASPLIDDCGRYSAFVSPLSEISSTEAPLKGIKELVGCLPTLNFTK